MNQWALSITLATTVILVAACELTAEADDLPKGFGEFLPASLGADWNRTEPQTMPAEVSLFGGGRSTRAAYIQGDETCVVTITGESPMLQGLSMPFSNPALVNVTGARMTRVGDERVIVKPDGEVQALAGSYLIQYTGSCSEQSKFAYVAITDLDGLAAATGGGLEQGAGQDLEAGANLAWDRTFGGPANDWAYAMTGTRDGGLITAGRTASKGAGGEDAYVVRVDGDGTLLWDRTYGGSGTDRARAIIETGDGGFGVAGATESKGAGEFDAWVLKLNAAGELIWDRHFGGRATDWASAMVETSDGGLAIAAYTQATSENAYDFWVIKLDGNGELLWERQFGGPATDWASAIAETNDRGLVVVGHTESRGAGDADMWIIKLTADGELLWDRTVGGSARDYASAVTATDDGGLVVAGPIESNGAEGVDIQVLKLDASGGIVWNRTFGGSGDDWVRAVVETRDGGHAVAGYTTSKGAGLNDVWLLKLDAGGKLLWDRTYGGAANEWARALVEMPDGGLALAGDIWSKGAGQADVWVLRVAPEQSD